MMKNPKNQSFKVGNVPIGRGHFTVIAGPCAVEDYDSLLQSAREIKEAGASILRGGAFKPRTSPKSFQGLGREGIAMLARVRQEVDIPVITEVMDPRHIEWVAEVADIFQIGSRSMHSYALLKEIGKAGKPVMLKRGMAATEKEFLAAAEYIMEGGEERIILCERGVRGSERNDAQHLGLGDRSYTAIDVFFSSVCGSLPCYWTCRHGSCHVESYRCCRSRWCDD